MNSLNMDGNILPYQLPASWAASFINLTWASISHAHLVSTLPVEWGTQGAFPDLYQLWLYGNPNLTGEVGHPSRMQGSVAAQDPPAWG